jgi:hypothetical protein
MKARQLRRARLRSRLIIRAVVAAAALSAGWLLVGWQAGLAAAGLLVALDLLRARPGLAVVAQWRRGAAGERRTARVLAPLAGSGWVVLHDRALPASRANIDHLVIGPAGVIVVDTKQWARSVRVARSLRTGRVGVIAGGRLGRGFGSLAYQAQAVRRELARAGYGGPVLPLAAVWGARGLWRGPVSDATVTVVLGRRARAWILRQPPALGGGQLAGLARLASEIFPPYAGPGRVG